ncbi:MAG: polyhydroxyalkanoate depolymerase [Pseudomonadota bacterium]|nr:polyhydroxyalkanoate depolymerase [Pseudomonadota bacterium]QKK04406.1 MAG: polyhydroxyalkanoate depolymerase [Pseudomonadota bacterium]
MKYSWHDFLQKSMKLQFNFLAQSTKNYSDAMKFLKQNGILPGLSDAAADEAAAASDFWDYLSKDHPKPPFGLTETAIAGKKITVTETAVKEKPFGTLKHFKRDCTRNDPKVLIVPPTSGHYASMMRDTVKELLPGHEVYVLDWENPRDVDVKHGDFSLEDYIDYVRDALEELGEDVHIIGFSQSTVPVLATGALMAAEKDKNRPASMTLMGGPIDVTAEQSSVAEFAQQHDLDWFKRNTIMKVPSDYEGAGREVYPGFLQLAGLMAVNADAHHKNRNDLIAALRAKDTEKSGKIKDFYDDYLAVSDLPAQFYLDTIKLVFQDAALAKGTMTHHGKKIDPAAVTDIPLLTVSGKKDEIVPPAQNEAAQDLCKNLTDDSRKSLILDKAGHYDLCSGAIFKKQILPELTAFIRDAGVKRGIAYDAAPQQPARKMRKGKKPQ